ncbi:unnamed protein product [Oikopleura dioica]|uniref:Uncharacterized protein n=1 Tax=Oikopleura dioica TaxID=34765 RepID=E4WWZ6_OIKDI|nr:unnamed protein product [Oikopleura dioica]CBY30981.1 unnamed protein product [Oikopleura dioica]
MTRRALSGIENELNDAGATVCFASLVEFKQTLDKERLIEAWKKTRSKEPFLRVRSEDKFVTTVALEKCQENAQNC